MVVFVIAIVKKYEYPFFPNENRHLSVPKRNEGVPTLVSLSPWVWPSEQTADALRPLFRLYDRVFRLFVTRLVYFFIPVVYHMNGVSI